MIQWSKISSEKSFVRDGKSFIYILPLWNHPSYFCVIYEKNNRTRIVRFRCILEVIKGLIQVVKKFMISDICIVKSWFHERVMLCVY